MIFVKNDKGELFTLKEISRIYNVPIRLVTGRYYSGKRTIKELIPPKYEMLRK